MEEPRFRAALDAVLVGTRSPVMHYQPIVDLRRGVVVGYEALARFPAPPELSPDRWLIGAQGRGKRNQLEARMMRLALESRLLLPPDTFLSVNVSPIFLLSREFDEILKDHADLSRIVMEVTEGDRVHDYAAFRIRLRQLRDLGASIAIDDTGSGYASLKHVMELRPQFVKLDRFFVENCQNEPAKCALIQMIGETADRMDAWLVAEGIETEQELQAVMRQGVPLAQGFFLGKPEDTMLSLADEPRAAILAHAQPETGPGLWQHLVSAPVYDSLESAQRSVCGAQQACAAIVVDEYQRPIHLVEKHPLLGPRTLNDVMRVQVASTVAEVLRRAMGRPLASRFDPLVVIGEYGEFQGVLSIDQLALAGIATA